MSSSRPATGEAADCETADLDHDRETDDLLAATPVRWFVRGFAAGVLITGAVNAVSYFFRSPDWRNLFYENVTTSGTGSRESIGFPLEVWQAGNTYGGLFADYVAMGWNVLFACGVGCLLGWLCVCKRVFLNRAVGGTNVSPAGDANSGATSSTGSATRRGGRPIQFSLLGIMTATTLVAVASMVTSKLAAHPATLMVIYALGPLGLVTLAMLPRRMSWQRRVVLLVPCAMGLIAVAMAVGQVLGLDFDRVLMGIFLSWTPQSALAAMVLTGLLLRGVPPAMPAQKAL